MLTDVIMPELSGLEMVGKIRAVAPACPVMFMTAYPGNDCIPPEYISCGLLRKPFDKDELLDVVRRCLSHSRERLFA